MTVKVMKAAGKFLAGPKKMSSFPRKRGSMLIWLPSESKMDSRFRGNDVNY